MGKSYIFFSFLTFIITQIIRMDIHLVCYKAENYICKCLRIEYNNSRRIQNEFDFPALELFFLTFVFVMTTTAQYFEMPFTELLDLLLDLNLLFITSYLIISCIALVLWCNVKVGLQLLLAFLHLPFSYTIAVYIVSQII